MELCSVLEEERDREEKRVSWCLLLDINRKCINTVLILICTYVCVSLVYIMFRYVVNFPII